MARESFAQRSLGTLQARITQVHPQPGANRLLDTLLTGGRRAF
jgi:hypothetical protein